MQQLINAIPSVITATFQSDIGNSFYNYGSTLPTVNNRIFPWFNTNDGRWYYFASGAWLSPYMGGALSDPGFHILWTGLEADLVTKDGGEAGPITPTTGAFWVVDHSFDGLSPMGPIASLAGTPFPVGTVAGGQQTLTVANLPPFRLDVTIPYTLVGTKNASDQQAPTVTGGVTTLVNAAGPSAAMTASPFTVIGPVKSTFVIQRTARIWNRIDV
jgi:hypothetical protein